MNLIVDIGNSRTKLAVVSGRQILFSGTEQSIASLTERFGIFEAAIMVSTKSDTKVIESELYKAAIRVMFFDHSTPVPIKNLYRTPHTLGYDRLAAAIGAKALYPNTNVAIFDIGTAITIDVVSSEGEYLGGNISPGGTTRLKALHALTDKLPLCSLTDSPVLIGTDTTEAIESGVANSVIFELEGYIERFSRKYEKIAIIFTGGEANLFAKQLKNTIFVVSDIIAVGLNEILEYNAD